MTSAGRRPRKNQFGRIARWLEAHRGRDIPHDYGAIAVRAGVSTNAVKCFFYRRRKLVRDKLAKLPRLETLGLLFQTTEGETVSSSLFASYQWIVNSITMHVWLDAKMRDGSNLTFRIPNPDDFIARVRGDPR